MHFVHSASVCFSFLSKFKDVLVMVNCLIKTGCRCGELVVASLCAAKPVQAEPSLYSELG